MTVPRVLCIAVAALSMATGGCGRRVDSDAAVKFGESAALTRTQAQTAFTGANDLTLEFSINRAVGLSEIDEDDLPVVLKPDAVARWNRAFTHVETYAAKLVELLSADIPTGFEESVVAFAEQLKDTKPSAVPDAEVAAAFAKLGSKLIELKAQSDARRIAQGVNPEMQDLFSTMADAIGAGPEDGGSLRAVVAQPYVGQIDELIAEFNTQSGSPEDKRAIVMRIINVRNARDAHDLSLQSLRQSLLTLGEAHAGLARGNEVTVAAALTRLREELKSTRDLMGRLQKIRDEANKKEEEERVKKLERKPQTKPSADDATGDDPNGT